MLLPRLLPWDYGVRNLMRRPMRTALTLCALSIAILMIFVVVGFIRGLESSLAVSGDERVMLVYSVNAEESLESSAIAARTGDLLSASFSGIQKRYGTTCSSPELYLGTRIETEQNPEGGLALLRGVTSSAPLVRRRVRIVDGTWPGPNEILVGKLVPAKLGLRAEQLPIGSEWKIENRTWKVSGHFVADGSSLESEIWCRLPDLQQALKRQDFSLVALLLSRDAIPAEIDAFCKSRVDLELQSRTEADYYASLQKHYRPVRLLAWCVVCLVAGSGVFAGLNMMYGAIAGRTREIATLQAIGFRRFAILISLIQEGALLAAAGSLIAATLAICGINGMAVRFTMGAFTLRIDSSAILVGCAFGLFMGIFGALPPALKALRLPVVESLKAI